MKRNQPVARIAFPAILGAFSLLLVYIASVSPTGNWGIVAVAGLFPAAVVISASMRSGVLCWAGVSVMAFLLVPGKLCALMYAALFGLYPIIKALLERLKMRPLEIILKLVFFNVSFSVIYLTMRTAVLGSLPTVLSVVWLLYLVGNVVFLVYDYGMSKLIALYIARIDRAVR